MRYDLLNLVVVESLPHVRWHIIFVRSKCVVVETYYEVPPIVVYKGEQSLYNLGFSDIARRVDPSLHFDAAAFTKVLD